MTPGADALRVGFAGTPGFAATALAAVLAAGHTVPLVLTQPDRPAGRGMKLQASAVKQLALDHGLALAQPRSLRLDGKFAADASAAEAALRAARLDVLVVAAYGLILPAWVLAMPRYGCLNIHGSLLPRWRGAAPVQRAIEAGDRETGAAIMQMDAGLDTGAVLLVERTAINADDTGASLLQRLADIGARLLVQALRQLPSGLLPAQPQPADGITYAHKIEKAEASIDWVAPAATIERRLRAFDPFPGCSAVIGGQPVKLWRGRVVAGQGVPGQLVQAPGADDGQQQPHAANTGLGGQLVVACGEGALQLLELQVPGGRRVSAAEFMQWRMRAPL